MARNCKNIRRGIFLYYDCNIKEELNRNSLESAHSREYEETGGFGDDKISDYRERFLVLTNRSGSPSSQMNQGPEVLHKRVPQQDACEQEADSNRSQVPGPYPHPNHPYRPISFFLPADAYQGRQIQQDTAE